MNPFKAPPQTQYTFLSLGAGVQSTCLALMAARNELPGINIDAAIFADTHAEPASVYKHLDWLEGVLPYPVHRVSKGNLTEESLRIRKRQSGAGHWVKSLLPVYTLETEGVERKEGHVGRACTYDYKVTPLTKKQKALASIKRAQDYVTVTTLIGISMDEIQRVKPSRLKWNQHRWPLIEMEMKRQDCINWMKDKGYPDCPRSACYYCPYHSNKEWRRLRDDEPEEFQKAVEYERRLHAVNAVTDNMRGVPFLHNSRVPLDQVDLEDDDPRQMWLWGNECEGMCGV